MTSTSRIAVLLALFLLISAAVFGQEDPAREAGLPVRIGGNRCDGARPGAVATVQGTFNVSGFQDSDKPPVFSVSLFAAGAFVSRQRVRNGGAFYFYCVPDQNVFLVAEVDAAEVSSYSLGALDPPPQTNYQDITLAWSTASAALKQRNQVISVRNSYPRSKENQKRFEKAMNRLHEDKGEATAKMLETLVASDPNDFVAMTELGNINFNNGRFQEADSFYARALTLKPDFVNALFGAGRTALVLKKIDRSVDFLTQAFKIAPDSADVNHYLGEAYLQDRKGSLAVVYMRRALELSPIEQADLHLRIAWLYDVAGAKDLAAEEYKLFLEKRPDYRDKQKLQQYIAENSK